MDLGWSSFSGGLRRSLESERRFEPLSYTVWGPQHLVKWEHIVGTQEIRRPRELTHLPGETGLPPRLLSKGKSGGCCWVWDLRSRKS